MVSYHRRWYLDQMNYHMVHLSRRGCFMSVWSAIARLVGDNEDETDLA